MIISHRHRFIFLKTLKTAGTSIEAYLSSVCGDGDIVTPFGKPVQTHTPRNFDGFYNHMPAEEVRMKIGEDIWNDYFKFCVVRNPWDKVISHYSMVRNSPNHRVDNNADLTLDDYLQAGLYNIDYPIYTDSVTGTILVDQIARYETLNTDLQRIFDFLGIPFNGVLSIRAKSEFRTDRRHYREILTETQAEQISRIYSHEIVSNGYSF